MTDWWLGFNNQYNKNHVLTSSFSTLKIKELNLTESRATVQKIFERLREIVNNLAIKNLLS